MNFAVIGRIGHGVPDLLVGSDDELPRLTVDAGGRETAAVEDGLKIFRLHLIARVFANRAACGHCGNSIHEKIPLPVLLSVYCLFCKIAVFVGQQLIERFEQQHPRP